MKFSLDNLQLYLVLIILVLSYLFWKHINNKNLAPGPWWGLPFFGIAPFLGKKPHITLAKLKQTYGDVIRITVRGKEGIVLTTYKAINEALVKQSDVFTARPNIHSGEKDTIGVAANSGEMWAEFRRFTLTTLRNYGFGKTSLEPQIMSEIYSFIKEVKHSEGKPLIMGPLLQKSVTNVICTIMTGQRYDYDDKEFHRVLYLTVEHLSRSGIQKIERALPLAFTMSRFGKWLGLKSMVETREQMNEVISVIIDRFEKTYRIGSTENFIDAWLTMSKKQNTKNKYFTKKHLIGVLVDLFLAGSDTTSNTLQWSLLYMAKYSDIQKKIQKEIDEVIGRDKDPTMADQKLMPYTEATLMEISRISTIVPLSIAHCTSKSTTLFGYHIPQGTIVLPNLWAVHHDSDIFPEPEKFQPERFLTDNQQLKRMNEFMPFSMGRRQCLGESLARMELFLYFTTFFQHFTIKQVDDVEIDFDYNAGGISQPKLQELCAISR